MTLVKPARDTGTAGVHDSKAIRQFIRDAFASLAKTPYDPETGFLPIRPDVHFYGAEHLAGEERGILFAGGFPLPTLALLGDGTASIRFVYDFRSLTFHVLCKGIIKATRTYADGQTAIEAYLPGVVADDEDAVEAYLEWLAGEGR